MSEFQVRTLSTLATTLASSGENIEVQVLQVQRESGRLVGRGQSQHSMGIL